MCFILHSEHSEKKKALKSITCWKNLVPEKGGGLFSPIFYHRYRFGKTYKLKRFSWYINEIHQGFHSFVSEKVAKHNRWTDEKTYKMIIPKGTNYYYNPRRGEYVSLAIKCVRPKKRK